MKCSKCGQKNQESVKFCSSCGFRILGEEAGDVIVKANKLLFWGGLVQILLSFIWFSIFFDDPDGAIPLRWMNIFGGILIFVLGIAFIVLSKINIKNLRTNSYIILSLSIVNLCILVYGTIAAILGFIAYRRIYKVIGPKDILSMVSKASSAVSAATSETQIQNFNVETQPQEVSGNKLNKYFVFLSTIFLLSAFFLLLSPLRYFGYIIFAIFSDKVELANQSDLFIKMITDYKLIASLILFVVYFVLMSKIKKNYQVTDLNDNISEKDSSLINKRIKIWGSVTTVWGGLILLGGFSFINEVSDFYDSYWHLAGFGYEIFWFIGLFLFLGILSLIAGIRVLLLNRKDNLYLIRQSNSISSFGWVLILAGIVPFIGLFLVSEALSRLKK